MILIVLKKGIEVIHYFLPVWKLDKSICDSNVCKIQLHWLLIDKLVVHDYDKASFVLFVKNSEVL